MLAKNSRLKKNKEFDLVFKEGRTVYEKILGVKVKPNNLESNRFGVLLSTKVSKLAVTRNLYKRRVKDIIRQESLSMKTGHDCVIIVLPAIISRNYQEIETEIKKTFNRLKLYR